MTGDLTAGEVDAEKARIAEREAAALPKKMLLTIADQHAGRSEAIVAEARRLGLPLDIERPESPAGKVIREFSEANPRESTIARLRAESRRRG